MFWLDCFWLRIWVVDVFTGVGECVDGGCYGLVGVPLGTLLKRHPTICPFS